MRVRIRERMIMVYEDTNRKICRGLKKERFLMVRPYALLIDTGYLYQRRVVVFLV